MNSLAEPGASGGGLASQVFSPGGQRKQGPGQTQQPPRPQDLELMWRALMMQPPPQKEQQMAPPPGEETRGMDVGAPPPMTYGAAPEAMEAPGTLAPYAAPHSAMLFGRAAPMAPWRMIEEEAKRQMLLRKMRPQRPQRVGQFGDARGGIDPTGAIGPGDAPGLDPAPGNAPGAEVSV